MFTPFDKTCHCGSSAFRPRLPVGLDLFFLTDVAIGENVPSLGARSGNWLRATEAAPGNGSVLNLVCGHLITPGQSVKRFTRGDSILVVCGLFFGSTIKAGVPGGTQRHCLKPFFVEAKLATRERSRLECDHEIKKKGKGEEAGCNGHSGQQQQRTLASGWSFRGSTFMNGIFAEGICDSKRS